MQSAATIFAYCERGSDPGFWAEPLNAVTNSGFILAAAAGAVMVARLPPRSRSWWHIFFIVNLTAIGVGSFLFHTIPNAQTVRADTIPIGIFMFTYLGFAMCCFVGARWFGIAAALAVFAGALAIASCIRCTDVGVELAMGSVPQSGGRCLNGSLGYAPAFIAMVLVGLWLRLRKHPASALIISAAAVFAVSLSFRSIDWRLCAELEAIGHRLGTHFLWHLLNSLTLFLLLIAAIRYGKSGQDVLPPPPRPIGPLAP